jgi:hypothetical protein
VPHGSPNSSEPSEAALLIAGVLSSPARLAFWA